MKTSLILRPAAWTYGRVMRWRNSRFDSGRTPITAVHVPVVSIGNLSVGGTGKTPMCLWLLRQLLAAERHPAMLSRGYGRKTRGFLHADATSTAREIGDEPVEVFRSLEGKVPVFVCEDRVHGAQRLLQADNTIDTIVLDDAYQHRFIHRDINILLTDYHRLYSRDCVLPEGRLRELPEGAARADIIVVSKCPYGITPDEAKNIRKELQSLPHQHVFFSAIEHEALNIPDLHTKRVLIFTGIAKPQPLIQHYAPQCLSLSTMRFADHHNFSHKDISRIATAANDADVVITTGKDFSRLPANLPEELRTKLRVQHIATKILFNQEETLKDLILDRVRK